MDGSEGTKTLMHTQSTVEQTLDNQGKYLYKKGNKIKRIEVENNNKKFTLDQTEIISQRKKSMYKHKKICLNKKIRKPWTAQEDQQLQDSLKQYGSNWVQIAASMANRNPSYSINIIVILQCTQRWKRIKPQNLKKRKPFSEEEDQLILQLVTKYRKNWQKIAQFLPERTSKQIRERFINKLNPQNKFEPFTEEEDQIIIKAYQEIGTKWTKIQDLLVGRPENMIKNRFYSYLRQKFLKIKNPYYSIPSKNNEIIGIDQKSKMENNEQLTEEKQLKENQFQEIKKEQSDQRNHDTLLIQYQYNIIVNYYIQETQTQTQLFLQPNSYSQIPQTLFIGNFSYPQYYIYQAPGAIVYGQLNHLSYTLQSNKYPQINRILHFDNRSLWVNKQLINYSICQSFD